jgi:hypothetical protein
MVTHDLTELDPILEILKPLPKFLDIVFLLILRPTK